MRKDNPHIEEKSDTQQISLGLLHDHAQANVELFTHKEINLGHVNENLGLFGPESTEPACVLL